MAPGAVVFLQCVLKLHFLLQFGRKNVLAPPPSSHVHKKKEKKKKRHPAGAAEGNFRVARRKNAPISGPFCFIGAVSRRVTL